MMEQYTENIQMLEYGLVKSYPDIFCFSTTRHGGYSEGNYASFNCNHYCGDREEDVKRNREHLRALLPQPDALVIPHQTHGVKVGIIDEAFIRCSEEQKTCQLEGVDALVTDVPGQCICVSTADCIPVLCYDVRHQAVAAIHAGWRGTVGRIVSRTLQTMKERYGTRGEDVIACIGPGISCEAFEVGDEVYEAFEQAGFEMQAIARRKAKWHLDLWEANRLQLLAEGVCPSAIEVAGICTYSRHEDFFSARRLGIRSGRILTGIMRRKKQRKADEKE